ncbi:MAG TPA: carboxypeptidase regulatory-like domain-containing protein [Longimicrobiaceae bacterium]|nr:carboxypeptidase regulatory-like domain-containing protein [Longimicrobiaceae bacterium]
MPHRIRTLAAPLALMLCALAAPPAWSQQTPLPPPPPPGTPAPAMITVGGEVLDALTGAPVRDVVISIPALGRKVLTDAQGRFVLNGIRSGTQKWVVSGLGYARWEEEVEATENGAMFTVRILPRPEVLEGITVVADRFQVRRAAEARSVRVVDRQEILASAAPSVFEIVGTRTGIRPMACGAGESEFNCATVRGRTVRPAVFIDDTYSPAGLEALRSMAPEEMFLIESYGGGRAIRVYTTWYVEKMSQFGNRLPPLTWW